jgi:DNA-binding response OmpR family regulator
MRVLLVEDEPDLGATLQKVLSHQKYVVDWVLNGTQAWDYLSDPLAPYTLVILDWMLPSVSGVELCQRLRAVGSTVPVLMLTARDRQQDKVTGLDAGADDYLVKPFGVEELLARLRALQRRSPGLQPQQLQAGPLTLDYGSSTVSIRTGALGAHSIALTAKEFQLIEYFLQHPNQLLSQEQIRHRLWTVESESASNVVAAQVRLLRRKLGEYDREDLIETVRGLGYRLNVPSVNKPLIQPHPSATCWHLCSGDRLDFRGGGFGNPSDHGAGFLAHPRRRNGHLIWNIAR